MTKYMALSLAIDSLDMDMDSWPCLEYEEAIQVLEKMRDQVERRNKKAVEERKRRDRNVDMILEEFKNLSKGENV